MTPQPTDADREAAKVRVSDEARAIDWLGGYKHPGVPALAIQFAEVRASAYAQGRADAEQDNVDLRFELWLRHGHSGPMLYGDDGEMQCNMCMIDFKRDSLDTMRAKWQKAAARARAAQEGASDA